MRQTAIRLNRSWLTAVGVVVLLAGAAALLLGTGLAAPLVRATGLSAVPPTPDQALVGAGAATVFATTWVVLVTAVVGAVVALLGLAWLVAQVPRTNPAKPFRLHDDARTGLTRVAPEVLGRAVEEQARRLPGVASAAAVIRGTTQHPELVLRVTADDRTDLPALLGRLQDEVTADLGQALDTQVSRLGVVVDVGATNVSSDHVLI